MALLGNITDESDIIENSYDNTLYKHDLKDGNGTYFNIQADIDDNLEKSSTEIQISTKIKVSVFYVKKNGKIKNIKIKKFKIEGGKWKEQEKISLTLNGIDTLKSILDLFNSIDLGSISERKISLGNTLDGIEIDENLEKQLKLLFSKDEGLDLLQEIIDTENLSKGDIIGVGYKKDQLDIFKRLLDDENYFKEYKNANSPNSDEGVWQYFFEQNKWIFGYGLNYVWLDSVGDGKLEQVVAGHTFNSSGKRIDGLLSTVSDIKKFVLVEIKKHNVDLIGKQYRGESWTPSEDLYGGVAQIQKSVSKFKKLYFDKANIKDKEGNPIDSIYNIQPKAYLIIGKLEEFNTVNGVNEDKYSSFELYRNNINGIEIITYDELYERARYIIENLQNN